MNMWDQLRKCSIWCPVSVSGPKSLNNLQLEQRKLKKNSIFHSNTTYMAFIMTKLPTDTVILYLVAGKNRSTPSWLRGIFTLELFSSLQLDSGAVFLFDRFIWMGVKTATKLECQTVQMIASVMRSRRFCWSVWNHVTYPKRKLYFLSPQKTCDLLPMSMWQLSGGFLLTDFGLLDIFSVWNQTKQGGNAPSLPIHQLIGLEHMSYRCENSPGVDSWLKPLIPPDKQKHFITLLPVFQHTVKHSHNRVFNTDLFIHLIFTSLPWYLEFTKNIWV